MKALLRSGDTQKIRFFANTARSKEIYLLAGNYLQSTDWKGDVEVVRDIETFYSKAQSPEHLSNFYIACAHVGFCYIVTVAQGQWVSGVRVVVTSIRLRTKLKKFADGSRKLQ